MSATELVILSSSPTTRCNYIFSPPRSAQPQAWHTGSTSPDLPTVSNLLATKEVCSLYNETRVAAQRNDSRAELEDASPQVELAEKKVKRVKKVKGSDKSNAGQALATGSDNPVKKIPRQRRKKVTEQSGENDEVSRHFDRNEQYVCDTGVASAKPRKKGQTAPRKNRSKGTSKEGNSQAKLAKTRITKPSPGPKALIYDNCQASHESKESQVSFVNKNGLSETDKVYSRESVEKNLSGIDNEMHLAVPRRTNWTPPKCSNALPPSNQAEYYRGQVTSETLVNEPSIFQFLPDYRFDTTVSKQTDTLNSGRVNVETPAKKRRLETTQLPKSGQTSDSLSKPKPQRARKVAQKKKARTITELAMAQYRLPDEKEVSVSEAEPKTLEPPTLENVTPEIQPKKPSQRKKRDTQSSDSKAKVPESKIKKKKVVKKPKKSDSEPVTRLLSPKAALASLQHQDLLFGTSSQLAREESPPYIRDLQRAFVESEKVVLATATASSCLSGRSKLSAVKRNLWEAAARDHDDELLLESKEADSSRSDPGISKDVSSHAAFSLERSPSATDAKPPKTSESCKSVGVFDTSNESEQKEQRDPPSTKVINALPTPENSNTPARPKTPPPPPPTSKTTEDHPDEKKSPNYIFISSPYEILSPKKQVIEKPITTPISSHSLLLSQLSTRSKESTGWTHIDEISDSEPEPEFTPSPPRRNFSSKSAPSPPAPISPLKLSCRVSPPTKPSSSSSSIASTSKLNHLTTTTRKFSKSTSTFSGMTPESANWTSIAPSLFAQITTTIKASPDSFSTPYTSNNSMPQQQQQQDIKEIRPSWYERMLMYEPIDIEALTVWLNKQGLRVPVTVKATVRKKRRGLNADDDGDNGKIAREKKKKTKKEKQKEKQAEKEEGQEEVEVRDKKLEDGELRQELRELSSWMVRKWCQEFSVCCVWRDGVNGWRRK